MSAEPLHIAELDSPTDILHIARLVKELDDQREQRLDEASRVYVRIGPLVLLLLAAGRIFWISPLQMSALSGAALLSLLLSVSIWWMIQPTVSRWMALRFSTSLRQELSSIDADRHRLVGLINEARVTLRPRMSELQRIELDVRLRQLAPL